MKKFLAIILVIGLGAAFALSGTTAYLTSHDADVNVMTTGSVYIKQHEQQLGDNGIALEPFEQYQPFYPGTEISKIVTVENTGKSDAYFRTLIAFEDVPGSETFGVGFSIDENDGYKWSLGAPAATIVLDGATYQVYEALYKSVLKPGKISPASLTKVELAATSTNEDMEVLGDEYNILVLSQAVQTEGFTDAQTALDTAFGKVKDKAAEWFKGVGAADTWDGTADISWYNDTDTEFALTTSEQIAGLAKLVDDGNNFAGKTIKLEGNLDLYAEDENGEPICFEPIGSYRKDTPFKGTFDGQGHTISNMSQNTWALNNGYYYGDLGLGLFGMVEDATIKDLVMDSASIFGESAICGTVAATAYGDCTFENITVKNSEVADYQYYSGGIVGWASGDHQYINCNIDASTTITAQWGDFDNSVGGVIGGAGGSATILIKDTTVACRIDAYNDVTSTYQWYAYRRCGMLIGNTGKTVVVDGTTYAAAPQLTCENVTVTYGDWANYTYCEFAGTSWPYVRVQAGVSNSAYSNPRYGHPTDANGNSVVDDTHVHNAGEDHFIECTFDQLYGGGQGVYGDPTHDGVTVIYNNK